VYGEEHTEVARGLGNLGALLRNKGDYEAAEPLLRESLAIDKKVYGEEHPEVAIGLISLGRLLQAKSDYASAEPLYREACSILFISARSVKRMPTPELDGGGGGKSDHGSVCSS